MALNKVIDLIEAGHIASFTAEARMDPQSCKKCLAPWPCPAISWGRAQVRLLHGVKRVA